MLLEGNVQLAMISSLVNKYIRTILLKERFILWKLNADIPRVDARCKTV